MLRAGGETEKEFCVRNSPALPIPNRSAGPPASLRHGMLMSSAAVAMIGKRINRLGGPLWLHLAAREGTPRLSAHQQIVIKGPPESSTEPSFLAWLQYSGDTTSRRGSLPQ